MKKRIFILLITIGILAQILVPAWMLISRELTLRHGAVCLLQTAPVDPVDPFMGRYVDLRFKDLNSVVVDGPDRGQWSTGKAIWISFKTNENSVAVIDSVHLEKPDNPLSVKARIRTSWPEMVPTDPPVTNRWGTVEKRNSGKIGISLTRLPFERYYMPEKLAPEAERAYNRAMADGVYAKIRFRNGQAVLEDLLFGSTPVRDYLKTKSKDPE